MEGTGGGTNDDEEPQICTVFSSTPAAQSKTIFDTIAFSIPKKETPSSVGQESSMTSPFSENVVPSTLSTGAGGSTVDAFQISEPRRSDEVSTTLSGDAFIQNQLHANIGGGVYSPTESVAAVPSSMFESLSMSYMAPGPASASGFGESLQIPPETLDFAQGQSPMNAESLSATPTPVATEGLGEESLKLVSKELEAMSLKTQTEENSNKPAEGGEAADQGSPVLSANALFADAPEVPFPVGSYGVGLPPQPATQTALSSTVQPTEFIGQFGGVPVNPVDPFSTVTYSAMDAAYDAWIPNEETGKILMGIATAVHAGTYFPDKTHMTTPGIIYKDDLVDKVTVNMSRIFGEVEASKRQILTADNVTQDVNGIRELIKLGCYRSAINLTKRLLTLYGQGPGKVGQFSKHSPQSLQLWMTRIALLVRIREFKIAESEIEAFNEFENPDMYYEYYQDSYGQGRKGSMVPFYFRLLAAEIPQYASKDHNDSVNKLTKILWTIGKILKNINEGISEDGSSVTLERERKEYSLNIWSKREVRVLYSLTNAFLLAKDFSNALRHLCILREKDIEKKAQLTSAIGRLFLQYGDLATSQKYFKEAASMRTGDSELERVENLVDAALYLIGQGVHADAFGLLKEALVIQPDNFMITNNMAVCLLYMGKVKESLALMETTVRNNIPQLLQENVILNLSTIYELENSDGCKKNALLKLISEYKGDGINLASLKMPNLI